MSAVKQKEKGNFPLLYDTGCTLFCIINIMVVFIIASLIGFGYFFDRIIKNFQRKG